MKVRQGIFCLLLAAGCMASLHPAAVFAEENGTTAYSEEGGEAAEQCPYTVTGGTYGVDYTYDSETTKLTLYGGTLTVSGATEGSDRAFIEVAPQATLNLTISDISPISDNRGPGLKIGAGATVNLVLEGENIFCLGWDDIHDYSLYLDSDAKVTISGSGSLICNNNYAYPKLYLADTAELTVKSGVVQFKGGQNSNSYKDPYTVNGTGKLVVDGGSVLLSDECRGLVFRNNPQIEVKSGELNLSYQGQLGNCRLTMYGGTLKSDQDKSFYFADLQYYGGTIDFKNQVELNGTTAIYADLEVPANAVWTVPRWGTVEFAPGTSLTVQEGGQFQNSGVTTCYCQDVAALGEAGGTVQVYHLYDQQVADDAFLKTAADCTNPAVYYDSCLCGAVGTGTFISGTALGHQWQDPTYQWSEDGKSCTATRVCARDESHQEAATATVTAEQSKAPTCTVWGDTTYTASFAETWAAVQTKTVTDLPATGHKLTKTEAKAPSCTEPGNIAYWTCSNCDGIFREETGTEEITLAGTVIPQTGHTYENGRCTVCGAIDPDFQAVIIMGANGTWQMGSQKDLSFTSNAAYDDFIKVQVDGGDLDPSCYTVEQGSTIVTLRAAYLETLTVGTHSLAIVSETGTATTSFAVAVVQTGGILPARQSGGQTGAENAASAAATQAAAVTIPQTGDESSPALWAAVMLAAGTALAGIAVYRNKKTGQR